MFRHEGPSRSPHKNAQLAGYLALVAGFVNSGGFILIGSFTSHVTGSIGRLSNDLATGDFGAATFASFLVLAFFVGAVVASLVLETLAPRSVPRAYGVALLCEGTCLLAFIFLAGLSHATNPRVLDAEAAILSMAMGIQNSLVTRLSGAVVRTTHLTGIVTDLGIELARALRARNEHPAAAPDRARRDRTVILCTVLVTFMTGAALGGTLTLHASRWAMLAPAAAIFLASAAAFFTADPAGPNRRSATV